MGEEQEQPARSMNWLEPLKPHMGVLLLEVLGKWEPTLVARLEGGLASLTEEERSRLTGAIAEEFTSTGLRPDYEPNARGLVLEDLIDAVMRVFLSVPAPTS